MASTSRNDTHFARMLKAPMYLWTLMFVLVAMLYVIGLSFLTRGEVAGVTGEITLNNYRRALHCDRVSLRLSDGKAQSKGALHCDAVDHRSLLDQRAHPHLRLAYSPHGKRACEQPANEAGAD